MGLKDANARCGKLCPLKSASSRPRTTRNLHQCVIRRNPGPALHERCRIGQSAMVLSRCSLSRWPVRARTRAPVEDRGIARDRRRAPRSHVPRRNRQRRAAGRHREIRVPTYTVKRAIRSTSIALDHGLDYKDLAAWNNLENPNQSIGQVLRVAAPGEAPATASGVTTAPLKVGPAVSEVRPGTTPGAGSAPRRASAPRTCGQLQVLAEGVQGTLFGTGAARCRARAEPPETVAMAAPSSVAKSEPPPKSAPAAPDIDDGRGLDLAGQRHGRRGFRNHEPKGLDIAASIRRSGPRERRWSCRLCRRGTARLRQPHHRQAQQYLPVRLRAQPRRFW